MWTGSEGARIGGCHARSGWGRLVENAADRTVLLDNTRIGVWGERIKRSRGRAARPNVATSPACAPPAAPMGSDIDNESDTTGIRLFTSALVTSVR